MSRPIPGCLPFSSSPRAAIGRRARPRHPPARVRPPRPGGRRRSARASARPLADRGRAGDVERGAATVARHAVRSFSRTVISSSRVDGEGASCRTESSDLAEFRIAGRRGLEGLLAVLVGALDAPGDAHREGVLVSRTKRLDAEVERADRGVVGLGVAARTSPEGGAGGPASRSQPAARRERQAAGMGRDIGQTTQECTHRHHVGGEVGKVAFRWEPARSARPSG